MIYDTGSQERFKTMVHVHLKHCHGFILVYNITSRESLQELYYQFEEIKKYQHEDAKLILVGTKCDLENREVSTEEGREIAEKNGIPFYEVSAKKDMNVTEVFERIINDVIEVQEHKGKQTETIGMTNNKGNQGNTKNNKCN